MKTSVIVLFCLCVCMAICAGDPHEEVKHKSRVPQICPPSSTFKEECNTCNCNAAGTSKTCTREICPHNMR